MESLNLSTGVRGFPSIDESLLLSFTLTIPPSVRAIKPPRLGRGTSTFSCSPQPQRLIQSGSPFPSFPIPVSGPVPSHSPTQPHGHTLPSILLSRARVMSTQHQATTGWTRSHCHAKQQEQRLGSRHAEEAQCWLRLLPRVDHGRATHPLWAQTQAFVKLMIQISYL